MSEVAWIENAGKSPPTHRVQISDILILSEKLKTIRITSNEASSRYCLQLFQVERIPPRKANNLTSQSEGIRKSFKQPYERKELGELTMRILVILLNICWGHMTRTDLENEMVGYIQSQLQPERYPLDYMIHILYSYLFSEAQKQTDREDSDEEFERATRALSNISNEPTSRLLLHPSLCPSSGTTLPSLEQRILGALRTSDRPMKALEIAIKLKIPKAEVNRLLYRVLTNEVNQSSDHTWVPVSTSQAPSIKIDPHESLQVHSSPAPSDQLESQIESYLRSNPSPCDAKTIRRALSVPRTKAVNQRLYELHRKRKVEKSDDEPPLWRLQQRS
jgi:hypothetical protein